MAAPRRPSLRRTTDLSGGVAGIEGPWLQAFDEAWGAYRAGDVPAGAVVVDPDGAVVAKGRNRVYDTTARAGRTAGSLLSHAAIDALSALSTGRRYEGYTLFLTTEPCPLCVGAAMAATVEHVRFCSRDVYAGAADQVPRTAHGERVRLSVRGPLDGPAGLVGAILQLEPFLRHNPGGAVAEAHKTGAPDVHAAAQRLASAGVLPEASTSHQRFTEVLGPLLAVAGAGS